MRDFLRKWFLVQYVKQFRLALSLNKGGYIYHVTIHLQYGFDDSSDYMTGC